MGSSVHKIEQPAINFSKWMFSRQVDHLCPRILIGVPDTAKISKLVANTCKNQKREQGHSPVSYSCIASQILVITIKNAHHRIKDSPEPRKH